MVESLSTSSSPSIVPTYLYSITLYVILLLLFTIISASLINAVALKATGTTSFPQGIWESCIQFRQSFYENPLDIQQRLLMAALKPEEYKLFNYTNMHVHLRGHGRMINAVRITRAHQVAPSQRKRVIFILHGYGSGLAFFFQVYPALLRYGDYEIHALDWLGMGNSSRPDFRVPFDLNEDESRKWVENWFIDSLEEYRVSQSLGRVTLLAHSFGAYLAVRYAQKFPDSVKQMILVSPVAVNKSPYAASTLPELVEHPPKTSIPGIYHGPSSSEQRNKEGKESDNIPTKNPLPRFIVALWDAHWTPFDFLRLAGPIGPKLCSSWSHNLPLLKHTYPDAQTTRSLIHKYTYSIFAAPASSERALSYILVAGGHARSPLESSLPQDIPTVLIYGKYDWMSSEAGRRAASLCTARGGKCSHIILQSGGHLSYLEAFPDFIESVCAELDLDS